MYKWQWSEASPWPPIQYVKAAVLYSDPSYHGVLDRFKLPVPVPVVTGSIDKTYKTVDTTTSSLDDEGETTEEKCAPFHWRHHFLGNGDP